MRLICSGLLLLLSCGCVAGPEEIAEDKRKQEEKLASSAAAAEVVPAAAAEVKPAATGVPDSDGFITTASGLKYRILREGTGRKPAKSSTVSCHYRGWLDSGKEFDSSYKRGEPTEFPLNGVIKGWTEGLQLIGEGGKMELEIPSQLGYGVAGMPGTIPRNATLHFEIELVKVK